MRVTRVIIYTVLAFLISFKVLTHKPERPEKVSHKVYKNNIKSTYKIEDFSKITGELLGCGTAVAISNNTLITVRHVINVGEDINIKVILYDDDMVVIGNADALVLREAKDEDLALLIVPIDLPYHIDVEDGLFEPEIGDSCYLIGTSLGFVPSDIRAGFFKSKVCSVKDAWLASAEASYGDSGGGMFESENNKLIGIVFAKVGQFGDVWSSAFINIHEVMKFLLDK